MAAITRSKCLSEWNRSIYKRRRAFNVWSPGAKSAIRDGRRVFQASLLPFHDFIGNNGELGQPATAERSSNRNVGCIEACGHQYPPYAQLVVPGIEGPPAIVEIGLKPCAEIHWSVRRRNADVA